MKKNFFYFGVLGKITKFCENVALVMNFTVICNFVFFVLVQTVLDPDQGIQTRAQRHHSPSWLKPMDSVDTQISTLPRNYKHSVKQPERKSHHQCQGNEHLRPMDFGDRNASKSNPELFGPFSLHSQHTPRRSNAYRHRDFEKIKAKKSSSSNSEDSVVVIQADEIGGIVILFFCGELFFEFVFWVW